MRDCSSAPSEATRRVSLWDVIENEEDIREYAKLHTRIESMLAYYSSIKYRKIGINPHVPF